MWGRRGGVSELSDCLIENVARDSYWEEREVFLRKAYSKGGLLSEIRTGMLSYSSAIHGLEFMIVGMEEEAADFLGRLVPKLRSELEDKRWIAGRSEYSGKELMTAVAHGASAAAWLQTGRFDKVLAASALAWRQEMQRIWGGRATTPNLLDLMLSAIESGQPDLALEIYRLHQPAPLAIPPKNFRFTRNACSILYLFLCTDRDASSKDLRGEALSKFLASATRWEKGFDPLPYVNILDVARIVYAAGTLEGRPPSLKTIISQVK